MPAELVRDAHWAADGLDDAEVWAALVPPGDDIPDGFWRLRLHRAWEAHEGRFLDAPDLMDAILVPSGLYARPDPGDQAGAALEERLLNAADRALHRAGWQREGDWDGCGDDLEGLGVEVLCLLPGGKPAPTRHRALLKEGRLTADPLTGMLVATAPCACGRRTGCPLLRFDADLATYQWHMSQMVAKRKKMDEIILFDRANGGSGQTAELVTLRSAVEAHQLRLNEMVSRI
jgi:hypothetical protein